MVIAVPNNQDDTRQKLEAFVRVKDPHMMEAAQELMDIMSASSFSSPEFTTQMLAYYSIEPPGIEAAIENLEAFCKEAAKSSDPFAKTVIKCFVDRIVADWFQISFHALTSIGIILGNSDYKEQGPRCLKRAGTLISQPRRGN